MTSYPLPTLIGRGKEESPHTLFLTSSKPATQCAAIPTSLLNKKNWITFWSAYVWLPLQ